MPPSSFSSYVAKDLSRLPPLTMNCFDITSLVKDIESLKIHTSILQQSYETVVKAQLLTCKKTSKTTTPDYAITGPVQHVSPDPVWASPTVTQMLKTTTPDYAITEPVQHVSPDPVWASPTVTQMLKTTTPDYAITEPVQHVSPDPVWASPTNIQMLDNSDSIAQQESDDDDLLLLASIQQTRSSSSTGQLKPDKSQPHFSSYADSVKTGRRKANTKSSRSTKPPATPTHTALIGL